MLSLLMDAFRKKFCESIKLGTVKQLDFTSTKVQRYIVCVCVNENLLNLHMSGGDNFTLSLKQNMRI